MCVTEGVYNLLCHYNTVYEATLLGLFELLGLYITMISASVYYSFILEFLNVLLGAHQFPVY